MWRQHCQDWMALLIDSFLQKIAQKRRSGTWIKAESEGKREVTRNQRKTLKNGCPLRKQSVSNLRLIDSSSQSPSPLLRITKIAHQCVCSWTIDQQCCIGVAGSAEIAMVSSSSQTFCCCCCVFFLQDRLLLISGLMCAHAVVLIAVRCPSRPFGRHTVHCCTNECTMCSSVK